VGHVADMAEERKVYKLWWESLKERDHLEDWGVDGRRGSELILGRLAGRMCIGFTWLRIGTSGRFLWTQWWTFMFWHHRVSSQTKYGYLCTTTYFWQFSSQTYVIQLA
jgi:hypothetical protein